MTIISYEEQTRGWMATLAKARTLAQQVEAYRRLRRHLNTYSVLMVLDFDDAAATRYQELLKLRLRVGTMDLKIASIALSMDALVVTRNLKDFSRIPGLRWEDWTRP